MNKEISNSFQCWFCEQTLHENRYVIQDGFAVCLICFEERFAKHCCQCDQIIGIEMQGKIFQDKTWHHTCFNCSICQTSLINQKFAYHEKKLYCRDCFIQQFAERCYRCNRPLKPGEKCTRYDAKLYHQFCFVCHACQQPLTNMNLRRRDQYFLCLSCHLHLVAIYCIKCHQAIANNGVLYHNHPFHSECFLCAQCGVPLRNERYVEHDQEVFCSACARNSLSSIGIYSQETGI